MSDSIQRPRGTFDILPPDLDPDPMENAAGWRAIEQIARETFEQAGYREIRTPVFEYTPLFVRGVGEATDIVEKEMYTIPSRAEDASEEDSLTLRPELTASVVRAYVEHNLHKTVPFQKFYYYGPLFRGERPAKGRFRQFHQFGVEVIGGSDPRLDADVILVAARLFKTLGLERVRLNVNSTGCPSCRDAYRETLKEYFSDRLAAMCDNCARRADRNVFRVLDCKEEPCQEPIAGAPPIREHLCADCGTHFDAVLAALDTSGQGYTVDPTLVRGLDYYCRTVFEFTAKGLGAQNAICGGGRYDNLVSELGGPEMSAIGFATGVERLLISLGKKFDTSSVTQTLDLYLGAFDDSIRDAVFKLVNALRDRGISTEMDFESRSVKSQMRVANRLNARYSAVLGPDELEKGQISLKEMATGSNEVISLEALEGTWQPS
jgi:histidyl-tRNA synthetase